MFRNKSKFDFSELTRRIKRQLDSGLSYKKLFVLLLILASVFYILPPVFRFIFGQAKRSNKDPLIRCMDDCLTPYFQQNEDYDANIRHMPHLEGERNIVPYIGNGYFSLEISNEAHLNIQYSRSLNLPVYVHPLVSISYGNKLFQESTVTDYRNGIVHRFQCFQDLYVAYEYYAHRTIPEILVQEIKITNIKNQLTDVELILPKVTNLASAQTRETRIQHGSTILEYTIISGMVNISSQAVDKFKLVSVMFRKLTKIVTLKKRNTIKLELLTAVHYSKVISRNKFIFIREENEKTVIEIMKKALKRIQNDGGDDFKNAMALFKKEHTSVWNELWMTGIFISNSKAENSINGDKINGTIYNVLSNVRSYEYEDNVSPQKKLEIDHSLTYSEGCFDSYHTLQAENLWLDQHSLESLNNLVASWMLTLEKQGCHKLIKAGASGVVQAIVLSIGGFRFKNQHLEFNIHPKFLHRDFQFRRLNYGNLTHVNVSVTVNEENIPVLDVALDRSDGNYYACDGGCLDEPVVLSQSKKKIPVKLTDPLTAILYITADKQHMEELHKAIHVKEVVDAPAHEHHVINLHKHGHHLGGLPTLFWVSICAIIIVFHVFLCKLIVKEYCEPSEKRYRYNKP